MTYTSRRSFLHSTAALAGTSILSSRLNAAAPSPSLPIVDAHIHLFDPTRPGGVPWPTPADTVIYHPALPERYSKLARPEGVLAAIAIECSPLLADNDWLLETAASNDIIVAVIGDLDPAGNTFAAHLDRLANNPLFRGIRYGNLWNRDLAQQVTNPLFLTNLRDLAHRGLVFESANPTPKLLTNLLSLASSIDDLRIVIDHLPQAVPPADSLARQQYRSTLKQLSEHPTVFIKGSEFPRRINGAVPLTMATYKPWLDALWELFGEDRIFFGSDWPNSDQMTSINDVFTLARSYLAARSDRAAHKFFWSNSKTVYSWKPRTMRQRIA